LTVFNYKHFLFLPVLILIVSLACGAPAQQQPTDPPPPAQQQPTDPPPPVQDADPTQAFTTNVPDETTAPAEGFDERLVRSMLWDIQQNLLEDTYRQDFATDINALEALRRWDSGVRVTNTDEFEKRIIEDRMEIVRKSEPTVPIDAMEISLSTD
jgi:hypothetical protein